MSCKHDPTQYPLYSLFVAQISKMTDLQSFIDPFFIPIVPKVTNVIGTHLISFVNERICPWPKLWSLLKECLTATVWIKNLVGYQNMGFRWGVLI